MYIYRRTTIKHYTTPIGISKNTYESIEDYVSSNKRELLELANINKCAYCGKTIKDKDIRYISYSNVYCSPECLKLHN